MKLTIIEDDVLLAEKLAKKLKRDWFLSNIYNSKWDFFRNFNDNTDVYIIDLNLWETEYDWQEIVLWLRKEKKVKNPIIITSAYGDYEKKIYLLDSWADDYLEKPFQVWELIARIRALLRRQNESRENIINYKNLEFDIKNKIFLSWVDKNINFTKKELMIIELFILNKNKLISKNKLITSVWWDYDGTAVKDNTINVTLHNLRNKIWKEFNITTVICEGYILKD